MKICWELLDRIKLTKNNNFRLDNSVSLIYINSCLFCSDPFFTTKQQINKGKKRPDVKERQMGSGNNMWKIGENHPMYGKRRELSPAYKEKNVNWKGGITKLIKKIRKLPEYKLWRSLIYERDNYLCQECKNRSSNLNAHHLHSFSNIIERENIKTIEDVLNCFILWDINNGITLCRKCHLSIYHPYLNLSSKI